MNLKGFRKKMKNRFEVKYKKWEQQFYSTELYKTYIEDKSIRYKSYFWFSFSSLILYPLIMGALLWLIVEKKSVIQIVFDFLKNWEKSLNLDMQQYIVLIKTIYKASFGIYLSISIGWLEFETTKITDNSIKIKLKKVGTSLALVFIIVTMWGRYDLFPQFANWFHVAQPMNKYELHTFLSLEGLISFKFYLATLAFKTISFTIINVLTLYYFNFRFKVLLFLFIMMIFYETLSSVISWITSEEAVIYYEYTVEFIILSFCSIFCAFFENSASLLGIIPIIICIGVAAIKGFNKTLLMNSFIIFIGYTMALALDNSKSIEFMFQVFNSIIVSLYICIWLVSKVKILKRMDKSEKSAVENIIKEIFGGGIIGAFTVLILTLLKYVM